MDKLLEKAVLDLKDIVQKRKQLIREKREYEITLRSVAPRRIKEDATKQIELHTTRIGELTEIIKQKREEIYNQNKAKEGMVRGTS